MKKLLFIIACAAQFVNAQTTPTTGEYISIEKSNPGINLLLNEDKTFQMFVLNGTYEVVNDSVIFNNYSSNELQNSFNVQFTKGKTENKKVTIFMEPTYLYSRSKYFLGIQNKVDGEIIYKTFNEYFNNEEIESYFERSYSERKKEEENSKLSFEIDKPYAIYVVLNNQTKAKIEKYLVASDVSGIKIDNNISVFDEIEMSGIVEEKNAIKVFINESTPLKFVNKTTITKTKSEIPDTKTTKKNWTYPGKKEYNDIYADSAVVEVDTAMAYTTSDYEFKAKVEKTFKEALLNIKKDSTKYLFVYYDLKSKKAEKQFNDFIDNYNRTMGYNMYSEYDAAYDKFNFYLATKSEEAFFKKNKVEDKSILILNKDGEIIASSITSLGQIEETLEYDSEFINNKLVETDNAILLSKSITNKKTSIPDLTKSLNGNYRDFAKSSNYFNQKLTKDYITNSIIDAPAIEKATIVIDSAVAVVDSAAVAYENKNFTYYKSEISEKILAEKLHTIFEYYNSKNIVSFELVNILLGEISGNHINFDLFKNEENANNKQEIKYINYILKYNEDEKIKNKIAAILSNFISEKQINNSDIDTYNAILTKLISYSGNNFKIIQNAVDNLNEKESGSEEANKLVDLFYTTLVNNKPIFENMDTQFSNLNTEVGYAMGWAGFKYQINALLNAQAWDVFKMNKTQDFERAIKWSELSNIVEKDNAYSLDTLGQLYFAVGRKSEAIVIQTKAVAIAKASNINHEEFEKALINMKK